MPFQIPSQNSETNFENKIENPQFSEFESRCPVSMPKVPPSSGTKPSKRRASRTLKPKKPRKKHSPAKKQVQVIDIEDSPPSPETNDTPLRPVFCLKNKAQIKSAEEKDDCFILEFDPYDDLEKSNLSPCGGGGGGDDDLSVVAEKGQVACRDYPHPRHTCAKYPFEKTAHDSHCKLCYCYVCDSSAPCSEWLGSSGHCHAFNNEAWNAYRTETKTLRQFTNKVK